MTIAPGLQHGAASSAGDAKDTKPSLCLSTGAPSEAAPELAEPASVRPGAAPTRPAAAAPHAPGTPPAQLAAAPPPGALTPERLQELLQVALLLCRLRFAMLVVAGGSMEFIFM